MFIFFKIPFEQQGKLAESWRQKRYGKSMKTILFLIAKTLSYVYCQETFNATKCCIVTKVVQNYLFTVQKSV